MSEGCACVIPARLKASRFPNKLLASLNGKPVIAHTIQRAFDADCFDGVYCFTDSPEIKDVAESLGCLVLLTGPAENGTERIAKNLQFIERDKIVNLQGDEPEFPLDALRQLKGALLKEQEAEVYICASILKDREPLTENENRVKVIFDQKGRVVDFLRKENSDSRNPQHRLGIQLGAYAYRKSFLEKYAAHPPSSRERDLSHEMLRFTPLPFIKVILGLNESQSVDVPEDLKKLRKKVRKR